MASKEGDLSVHWRNFSPTLEMTPVSRPYKNKQEQGIDAVGPVPG